MSVRRITYKSDYEIMKEPLSRFTPAYEDIDFSYDHKTISIPVPVKDSCIYFKNDMISHIKNDIESYRGKNDSTVENSYFGDLINDEACYIVSFTFKMGNERLLSIECDYIRLDGEEYDPEDYEEDDE